MNYLTKKIRIIINTICLLGLVLFTNTVMAQRGERTKTLVPVTAVEETNFVFPEIPNYPGTYQFIFKQKKNISIHTELLQHIEASRKEDEDIILNIAPFCDVLVLSKNKIKSSDFIPFESSYKLL